MYLEIFLADFAFFGEIRGISWKYLNFADPRLHEISEGLLIRDVVLAGNYNIINIDKYS